MSATGYRNIHGRRGGRGLRPWLLIPKYLLVGVYIGGLASVAIGILGRDAPATPDQWQTESQLVGRMFTRVIVPALIGVLMLGVLLALSHPGVFIRTRWFQVKLLLVAVMVPAMHTHMRGKALALRSAIESDLAAAGVVRQELLVGTLITLAWSAVIIILGRLKPRLGQNPARATPSAANYSSKDAASSS